MTIVAIASSGQAAGEPAKPRVERKTFDFTRPSAGEILPNPSTGRGVPPKLTEFSPSTTLRSNADGAADETAGRIARAGRAVATARDPAVAAAARTNAADTAPPARPTTVQSHLPALIQRLGIEGFLSQAPQTTGTEQERQQWESVRRDLATSLAGWKTLYEFRAKLPSDAGTTTSVSPRPEQGR